MSKVIGIDLGTGASCVSVFEGGRPVVIANSEGKRTTPSVVSFDKDGERKIGDVAKRQAVTNPENTVYEVKRLMGNKYDECTQEIKRVTYKIVNENDQPRIKINNKKYSPEEISAIILQKMKQTAEDYLGEGVSQCVVTVPAYFDDTQRNATKNAVEIAGMECLRVINEPTSAAIAFGIDKCDKDMKVVVWDCGSGTHDVSILEFGGGVFEGLATDGDSHLGGSDFDERITNWLIEEFKEEEGIDLTSDPMAMQRLKEASEKAKIELSSSVSTEINLPYITANETGPKHIIKTLTRAKFESLIADLIERTMAPCRNALKAAGLSVNDIDEVLLVGGSSRIPCLQKAVEDFFGRKPSHGVNPDEAVAIGAGIQGAILSGDENVGEVVLLDVTPLNLGIETMGNVLTTIVESNTTIPCKKTMTFSNAADMQSVASIMIYSGNRPMAYQNKLLGQFNIEITPSPRGMNQIEVSFDINANGILTVSAVDKALNKPSTVTIESSSNLSQEDIERMKAEAEANAEEDKKLKEASDKINNADAFALSVEKTVEKEGEHLTESEKEELKNLVDELKKAVTERDIDKVTDAQDKLEKKWTPIVQKLYSSNMGGENLQDAMFGQNGPFGGYGFGQNKSQNTANSSENADTDNDFQEVK